MNERGSLTVATIVAFAALVVAAGGIASSWFAQTVSPGGGSGPDLLTWVQGGGAAAAVTGLAYIARLLATGRLVARDPAEQNAIMRDLIEKQAVMFERLADLGEQAHKREDSYHRLLTRRLEGDK